MLSCLTEISNGGGKVYGNLIVLQKTSYLVGIFWKIRYRPGTSYISAILWDQGGVAFVNMIKNLVYIFFSIAPSQRQSGRKFWSF